MEESQRNAVLELAEGYLWRAEVKQHQVMAVVTVLEALGYLSDIDGAHIQDDMDLIFKKDEHQDNECSWIESQMGERIFDNGVLHLYCSTGHDCENQKEKVLKLIENKKGQEACPK